MLTDVTGQTEDQIRQALSRNYYFDNSNIQKLSVVNISR